jgi:hypothetical protein
VTVVLDPNGAQSVTTTAGDAADNAPARVGRPLPYSVRFTARWVALLLLLAVVFLPTWTAVAEEIRGHSPLGYLIALPAWVGMGGSASPPRRAADPRC